MFLFTVLAQRPLGQMHQLGPTFGVLNLSDIDIRWIDARRFERRVGGVAARGGIEIEWNGRAEHVERSIPAGAKRDGAQLDWTLRSPGGRTVAAAVGCVAIHAIMPPSTLSVAPVT
jgi:hypothetical protein